MTIHFTSKGIFADTEEEHLAFLDRQCAGDPVVIGHILLWREELQKLEQEVKP